MVDCGSEMSLRRLVVSVEFACGPIDVWFGNAGFVSNGGLHIPDEEASAPRVHPYPEA